MANFFPNAPPSSSMQFAPDGSQVSMTPQEGTPSQSLGGTSNIPPFTTQGPTLPPLQHRGDGFLSLPQHGFTPQQSHPAPQQATEIPPPNMPNSTSDYNHVNEEFHPYKPTEKPEARNNKSSPIHVASADSPEGRPASNGRRRTRTKVVAWDPKDLEDIYQRKEIKKEDWDTICMDYPTRTKVAMRQQVIKLREKKQREAMGLGHRTGRSSTYSDAPQPPSSSNGIRWATVNGSSPANIDPYQRRQSFEDEESSEEYDLSSEPDSDHEGKLAKHFDHRAGSTPQQPPAHPVSELTPQQPGVSSMPVIIQEAPQANAQAPLTFDVLAAQSRGKPIAPRQPPPPPPSMPAEIIDDRQPPPPPPPEFRPTQRIKRGREIEATGSESRSSSHLGKRRKHHTDPAGAPVTVGNALEGYVAPFNPAASYPMPPQPPRLPQESELDELCIRFRDTYRMMKAAYEEDQRMREEQQRIKAEMFEASLGRANARAVHAERKADEVSLRYADQMKEDRLAMRLEMDHLVQQAEDQQAKAEHQRAETKKWRDEHAKINQQLAASIDALERERNAKPSEPLHPPHTHTAGAPESSGTEAPWQDFKQDAERANAANDLLAEEVTRMRSHRAETRHKLEEIKTVHGDLTATLDNLVSQDLTDLTQKMIKKHVLDVKGVDRRLADKIKEVEESLDKYEHSAPGTINQPASSTSNGPVTEEKS
ncbi:MAG: hypothetical protein Q9225_004766 [Loekoesia sp. 1 TL-2023]